MAVTAATLGGRPVGGRPVGGCEACCPLEDEVATSSLVWSEHGSARCWSLVSGLRGRVTEVMQRVYVEHVVAVVVSEVRVREKHE